ncbi:MAG: hypothetical protein L3J98_09820 [Gammaproteobacteria bacterium]|nr:hypothetical protein [Gammaproteobacteria bacterium]MCF6260438.1 hypothetical protein [Gammaproteobacteria bacterium]
MKVMKLERRFESLIATMNVPQTRKKGTAINALWFLRDGAIANRTHKNVHEASEIAVKLANAH